MHNTRIPSSLMSFTSVSIAYGWDPKTRADIMIFTPLLLFFQFICRSFSSSETRGSLPRFFGSFPSSFFYLLFSFLFSFLFIVYLFYRYSSLFLVLSSSSWLRQVYFCSKNSITLFHRNVFCICCLPYNSFASSQDVVMVQSSLPLVFLSSSFLGSV